MKLARVALGSSTQWGVIDGDRLGLLDGEPFDGVRPTGESVELASVRLLAPVRPSKILCLGRNYRAHVEEMGYSDPGAPSIFMKPPNAVIGPDDAVVLPPTWLSSHVEHEAELGIVVGRPTRFVSEGEVADHLLGFTCADDVSARDLQREDPHPTRGKGFDTFCPVGPWIETDLDLAGGVGIGCRVNDELRQDGSTADMIFGVAFLVSYISQFTTLLPGDLILTGSPGGTGPLVDGDRVEIDIAGIGVLHHTVVAST